MARFADARLPDDASSRTGSTPTSRRSRASAFASRARRRRRRHRSSPPAPRLGGRRRARVRQRPLRPGAVEPPRPARRRRDRAAWRRRSPTHAELRRAAPRHAWPRSTTTASRRSTPPSCSDGAFVHLPDGCALAAPIHCLFVSLAERHADGHASARADRRRRGQPRHASSSSYVGRRRATAPTPSPRSSSAPARRSPTTRCSARTARAFHLAAIAAAQAGDSRLTSRAIALGGALVAQRHRHPLRCRRRRLRCSTASTSPTARSTSTTTPRSTTRQPHGTSRELYKGILDGRATGVFNGKVFVRPDAQKTDAQQMNKNLLLSRRRRRSTPSRSSRSSPTT